jgi:hypothetical protein
MITRQEQCAQYLANAGSGPVPSEFKPHPVWWIRGDRTPHLVVVYGAEEAVADAVARMDDPTGPAPRPNPPTNPHEHREVTPSTCSEGHEFGPGKVIVGWVPCPCPAEAGGHRTVTCRQCGEVWYSPPHDPGRGTWQP